MKIMNLKERNEDAVSPVIGVMLMLVVTIVIAAVVAAFAGGIATDTEPTPSVVLSADVYANNNVVVQSLTGDRLDFSEIDVLVYKEDGKLFGKATPSETGYLTPGMKFTVTITPENAQTITKNEYVQVVVSYNDKHTVLDKEVQVK